MNNNYVILVDENGQPYIVHSIFGDARKKGSKYIERIKEGAKTRYFYTKSELDAYRNKQQVNKQAYAEKSQNVKAYKQMRRDLGKRGRNLTKDDDAKIASLKEVKDKKYAKMLKAQNKGTGFMGTSLSKDTAAGIAKDDYQKAYHDWDNARKDKKHKQDEYEKQKRYYDSLVERSKNDRISTINNSYKNALDLVSNLLRGPVPTNNHGFESRERNITGTAEPVTKRRNPYTDSEHTSKREQLENRR